MKYDTNNIFARILAGQIPCNKVFEDGDVLAFHDIHPAAPVHVLVLPKGQYCSFDDFCLADPAFVQGFFAKVRHVAHMLGLAESGYRLIMNHGPDARQTVQHYHVHILGKTVLGGLVAGDKHHA